MGFQRQRLCKVAFVASYGKINGLNTDLWGKKPDLTGLAIHGYLLPICP
jgi:hypothetical protein